MTVIIRNAEAWILLPDPWGPHDVEGCYALARIVEDRAVCRVLLSLAPKGSMWRALLQALIHDSALSAALADELRGAAAELAMLAEGDAPMRVESRDCSGCEES